MIGAPPSLAGADHVTESPPLVEVRLTALGAPGTVALVMVVKFIGMPA